MAAKKPDGRAVPTPVLKEDDDRLAGVANDAFDGDKYFVKPNMGDTLDGVPLSEALDPAKVADYCQREPWRLTSRAGLDSSPVFGIIPARFDELAANSRETGDVDAAAAYEAAARASRKIYHQQIQQDFRSLAASMNRNEIGVYAQNIWTRVYLRMDETSGDADAVFIPTLFNRDVGEDGSDYLKQRAAKVASAHVHWVCMNINEIPLSGYKTPGATAKPTAVAKNSLH